MAVTISYKYNDTECQVMGKEAGIEKKGVYKSDIAYYL